jgi:hypothetical protein
MISRADLVHDLADVLHQTRMTYLVDGSSATEGRTSLPTRRDREQAEEVVERLVELGVFGAASLTQADDVPPELVAG